MAKKKKTKANKYELRPICSIHMRPFQHIELTAFLLPIRVCVCLCRVCLVVYALTLLWVRANALVHTCGFFITLFISVYILCFIINFIVS